MSLYRKILASVGFLGLLAGCGFQPLYHKQADSPYLGQIKVGIIQEHAGQKLRNLLMESFAPFEAAAPQYQLNADIQYSIRNLSVQKDATTSRSEVVVDVKFALIHIRSGKVLFKGTESATADYNILSESPYSTLISKQDAHNRLLETVAQGITRRIAAFFKRYNPDQAKEKL